MGVKDFKSRFILEGDDRTGRAFGSVAGGLNKVAGAAIAIGAATVGMTVFIDRTKQAITTLDKIGKTADSIGISTDALQELRLAADLAGVPVQRLDKALSDFARRIGDAEAGLATAKREFDALGVSIFDSEGKVKPIEVLFGEVADGLKNVENQSIRARIAFNLFGRAGVAMTNLLDKGSDGIERMRQEAREMGIVLDERVIRNAEKMNDRLTVAGTIIDAVVNQGLVELAPLLVTAAEGFAFMARQVGGAVKALNQLVTMNTGAVATFRNLESRVERLQVVLEDLHKQEKRNLRDLAPDVAERANDVVKMRIKVTLRLIDDLKKKMAEVAPGALKQMGLDGAGGGGGDRPHTTEDPAAAERAKREREAAEKEKQRAAERKQREEDQARERFEALAASLDGEVELERLAAEQKQIIIRDAFENEIIGLDEFNRRRLEIGEEFEEKRKAIAERAAKEREEIERESRRRMIDNAETMGEAFLALGAAIGGKQFEQSKGFRIAEAFIHGAAGIARAFAEHTFPIPAVPIATIVAANAAAQIAAIAGAKPGSAGRPSVGGAGGGGGGSRERQGALAVADPTRSGQPITRTVVVRIEGRDTLGIREIIAEINEAIGDGVDLRT